MAVIHTNGRSTNGQPIPEPETGTMLDGIRQKVFADRYSYKDETGTALEHYPGADVASRRAQHSRRGREEKKTAYRSGKKNSIGRCRTSNSFPAAAFWRARARAMRSRFTIAT